MKRKETYGGETRAMYLEHYAVMGMLPTPDAASGKTGYMGKNRKGKQQNLETVIRNLDNSFNSQLNPRFVAEMMGFPPNWTELPFQNGETNP